MNRKGAILTTIGAALIAMGLKIAVYKRNDN